MSGSSKKVLNAMSRDSLTAGPSWNAPPPGYRFALLEGEPTGPDPASILIT